MGMPGLTQESLLALLAFDSESGPLVKSLVPLRLWERFYQQIATTCYEYIDNYGVCPGEHFVDLIEELCAKDKSSADILRRMANSMEATYEGVNKQYILDQATKFVRQQRLKSAIVASVELLQSDRLDEAEQTITESIVATASMQDLGTLMTDSHRMLQFLDHQHDSIKTGITYLDIVDAGPARKMLHLFVAPPTRGKSWWLIHLGKMALMQHLQVVHITLEMSEKKVAQRYCQSFFAVTKRPEHMAALEFEVDELGRFVGMARQETFTRPSIQDNDISKYLMHRLDTLRSKSLVIKEFPTGSLTVREIDAYLDSLWVSKRISPDLLIVDYADLMHVDSSNLRIELGAVYKDLRGLAVRRNIAIATASQSNRESESAKVVRGKHLAEDISKFATVDVMVTYSQTDEEMRLGLARLFLAKNRDDEASGLTVLISQHYRLGQFVVSSARMVGQYWDEVKTETAETEQEKA